MNDVTFVEAARKLGERILANGGKSNEEQVAFAFRTVTSRYPISQELTILSEAFDEYRAEYILFPEKANATIRVGESSVNDEFPAIELAAATALANVILNLEEATTRE